MAENITFDEPEGFVPPENLDSDDTFQAMATFKVLPGNQLQLVDIEGYQLGEGDAEEQEEREPGAGEASQSVPTAAGPPNMSTDQLAAPLAAGQHTAAFSERLGQIFRKATRRR